MTDVTERENALEEIAFFALPPAFAGDISCNCRGQPSTSTVLVSSRHVPPMPTVKPRRRKSRAFQTDSKVERLEYEPGPE
jgi:hypothetical protein